MRQELSGVNPEAAPDRGDVADEGLLQIEVLALEQAVDEETLGIEAPASASTRKPASPGLDAAFWKVSSATSILNELSSKSKTRYWFVPDTGRLRL